MGIAEEKIKGATVNLTALRESLLAMNDVYEVQIIVSKTNPEDPYSMDVLSLNVVLKSGADKTQNQRAIQKLTKTETEITPVIHFMELEALLEQAGGLKFQEIVDSRVKPA
jgi:phenylacetate-coenzyme A ligase PaaK-like adenylate-forming protein